jgi:hypothetical protein
VNTVGLKSTICQLDLIDINKAHHPTTTGYTFLSTSHVKFRKIALILAMKHISKNFPRKKLYKMLFEDNRI